jgi:uncharacterized surface protein with fasciclin (FAS1) repeats
MAMFEELGQLLTTGSTLSKLGSLTGGDTDRTTKAIGGAVPLLLGALGKKSASPAGAAALFNLLKGDNGGMLDNIGGFLDGGDKGGIGATLLGGLLGKRGDAVQSGLAEHSGLPVGAIGKLLPMLAPLVIGFLAKKRAAGNLDQASFSKLLSDESTSLNAAGHGQLLGLLDGGDDDDHRGFLDGLTKIAGLGGLGSLLPGLGKVAGVAGAVGAMGAAAAGAATAKVADAAGAAGAATSRVTGAAAATAGKVTGAADNLTAKIGSAAVNNEVKKKRGLMWLLPLLALAAIIALIASQCSKDDKKTAAVDTTVAAAAAVDTTVAAAAAVDTTVAVAVDTTVAAAPETTVAAAAETTVAAAAAPAGVDLFATAGNAGNLSTLSKAVEAAGLTDTLKTGGPFTLFAPTDDAFKALPAGVLDALMKPANKDVLASILKYHLVSGAVPAAKVVTGDVPSVEGTPLSLVADGGKVTVNGANVITADVASTNGVVHVIDQVLVPKSVDVTKLVNAAGDAVSEDLTIYFASGSAVINAEGQAKIAKAVETLKAKGSGAVAAVGHADTNGDPAKNLALSQARAKNVVDAITSGLGADASKFTFSSDAKGDTEPMENLSKSRRVTVEVS